MEGKGKFNVQARTAVARELTGFIWAIEKNRRDAPVKSSAFSEGLPNLRVFRRYVKPARSGLI
jgi:hypothetical protein